MTDATPRTASRIAYAVVAASVLLVIGALLAVLLLDDEIGINSNAASNAEQTPFVSDEDAVELAIQDFRFSPEDLTINAGTTVTWANNDAAVHDATERDHSWNTELLSKGEAGEITFDEPGTFEYFCSIHPWMEASITVR